jgi:hypothetical protein
VGEGSSIQKEDESYRQFVNSLARSKTDKAFTIQKEYISLLDLIAENTKERSGHSDELVDYDSSENSQASDVPFLTQGQGILALVVPMVERTDESSQPDPDTQEDPLSQVDNPSIDIESPGGDNIHNAGAGEGMLHQVPRMSSMIDSMGVHNARIEARAMENTSARNIPGTNLNTHNSFALLDDEDILNRALEMGVNPDSLNLEKINYLKDLEIARHTIVLAQNSSAAVNNVDTQQILLLGLGSDQSSSDREMDEDDFTPVVSRRKRRSKKSACKLGWSGSQSKSGDAIVGAQSKSCAAQVKASNNHPLSGIAAGSRRRKQNPKYL